MMCFRLGKAATSTAFTTSRVGLPAISDCTISASAPEWASTRSISAGLRRVLIGTQMAPARKTPYCAIKNAALLPIKSATRAPGPIPRAVSIAAQIRL